MAPFSLVPRRSKKLPLIFKCLGARLGTFVVTKYPDYYACIQ